LVKVNEVTADTPSRAAFDPAPASDVAGSRSTEIEVDGGSGKAPPWLPACVSLLLYLILTFFEFGGSSSLGSAQMIGTGTPDQVQQIWFLKWAQYALWHGHNPFYTPFQNYPVGLNLLANTSMLVPGAVFSPVTAWLGPVVTWNVLIRLAVVLSAFSMCLVLRRWTAWWPAAFVGGLLYGFSAYFTVYEDGYLFLVLVPIPPLIFLLLHEIMVRQQWRARRVGSLLGVAVSVQFFISAEISVSTLLMGGIACVIYLVANRRSLGPARSYMQTSVVYGIAVVAVLLVVPVLFMNFGAAHISGVPQLAGGPGELLGAVIPGFFQAVKPSIVAHAWTQFNAYFYSAILYLGIPLIVILTAIVVWLRKCGVIALAAVMAVIAFVLSLGSSLYVDQHNTGIPLPFAALSHLPIFDGIVAARFSLFTNLFAAIILAVGLDQLSRNWRDHAPGPRSQSPSQHRGVGSGIACMAIALVVAVSLWPSRTQPSSSTSTSSYVTSGAGASIPVGSVVLAYPYPNTPVHTYEGHSLIFFPFVQMLDNVMLGQAIGGFPFKLIGGYGWAPGTDEQNPNPTPLRPSAVEAFFNASFYGSQTSEQAAQLTKRVLTSDLRAFMHRYGVDAVIVLPLGRDPEAVARHVTDAIGAPSQSGRVMVWLNVQRRLSRMSAPPLAGHDRLRTSAITMTGPKPTSQRPDRGTYRRTGATTAARQRVIGDGQLRSPSRFSPYRSPWISVLLTFLTFEGLPS
jgi:hypothetical protein